MFSTPLCTITKEVILQIVAWADILLETFTLNTLTNSIGEDLEDDKHITAEEIEAEFAKLGDQAFAHKDGDGLAPDVALEQVYDISELDNIWAGAIPMTVDEELKIGSEKDGNREDYEAGLLESLGVRTSWIVPYVP
jgi:hypothetical protein